MTHRLLIIYLPSYDTSSVPYTTVQVQYSYNSYSSNSTVATVRAVVRTLNMYDPSGDPRVTSDRQQENLGARFFGHFLNPFLMGFFSHNFHTSEIALSMSVRQIFCGVQYLYG